MFIHRVRPGESLYTIARSYGVNLMDVISTNALAVPDSLAVGQAVMIFPNVTSYTVDSGDSLYRIAARYGLSVKQLLRLNPLFIGRQYIQPGDRLIVSFGEEKRGRLTVNGYAYPSIAEETLDTALVYLTYLTPFTHRVTPEGELVPLNDASMRSLSRANGVKTLLSVSSLSASGGFSSVLSDNILNSEAASSRLRSEITETVLSQKDAGVDMDFEYIYSQNAASYAAFIASLSEALRPLGKTTVTALAPKVRRSQEGILYQGHDYAAIGRAGDFSYLMTYEWGYTYGPPMAVAPLPNVRQVLTYAVSEIPREKLWMGLPNYGYDWTLPYQSGMSRAQVVSPLGAVMLAKQAGAAIMFDETARAPYFTYTAFDGKDHVVWFDNAESLNEKLLLLSEFSLSGCGIWNIMYKNPALYTLLTAFYDL